MRYLYLTLPFPFKTQKPLGECYEQYCPRENILFGVSGLPAPVLDFEEVGGGSFQYVQEQELNLETLKYTLPENLHLPHNSKKAETEI